MEVTGASTADAATITQYSSNGCQCQQFRFESAGTGWWRIIARHSGKAVDLWEWNTADGAEYRQWPVSSGYNQQFSVQNIGDAIQLINRHSGKALEVWEWSTANGARISQFTDLDGANQQWRLVVAGTTTPTTGGGNPSDDVAVEVRRRRRHRHDQGVGHARRRDEALLLHRRRRAEREPGPDVRAGQRRDHQERHHRRARR